MASNSRRAENPQEMWGAEQCFRKVGYEQAFPCLRNIAIMRTGNMDDQSLLGERNRRGTTASSGPAFTTGT